jgi:hypothetical protein
VAENCAPRAIACGILGFSPTLFCPPTCTFPQGVYQNLVIKLNNPGISGLQLIVTPPTLTDSPYATSMVTSVGIPIDLKCADSVCGPFSINFSTPGTWTLSFTPIIGGEPKTQPLVFNIQVLSSIPTPEFPFGSLLALLIPMAALFLYVERPRLKRTIDSPES